MSPKTQHAMLKLWHAWLAGGYLVAYVTADEDTYSMHLFAGYTVLIAIAVRLVAGMLATSGPWRLPRPSVKDSLAWLTARKGRNPLFAWFAVMLLAAIGIAAVLGAFADGMAWLEDPHEAVSEASLWVIFGHIAFVTFMYGGKRLLARTRDALSDFRLAPAKETSR
jgi:cytochrome b